MGLVLQIGMDEVLKLQEKGDEKAYQDFKDKFKPKKTTDDCYTPALVMDAVNEWVAKEYRLNPATFVRPFWPGGDYEVFDYPEGCTVSVSFFSGRDPGRDRVKRAIAPKSGGCYNISSGLKVATAFPCPRDPLPSKVVVYYY